MQGESQLMFWEGKFAVGRVQSLGSGKSYVVMSLVGNLSVYSMFF